MQVWNAGELFARPGESTCWQRARATRRPNRTRTREGTSLPLPPSLLPPPASQQCSYATRSRKARRNAPVPTSRGPAPHGPMGSLRVRRRHTAAAALARLHPPPPARRVALHPDRCQSVRLVRGACATRSHRSHPQRRTWPPVPPCSCTTPPGRRCKRAGSLALPTWRQRRRRQRRRQQRRQDEGPQAAAARAIRAPCHWSAVLRSRVGCVQRWGCVLMARHAGK